MLIVCPAIALQCLNEKLQSKTITEKPRKRWSGSPEWQHQRIALLVSIAGMSPAYQVVNTTGMILF
jgi:hypothetical protein